MNRRFILRVLLTAALVAGIALALAYRDQINASALESWVREAGPAAPLAFMAIYAVGTVLFFPGAVLTLLGGALFGPVWGTFYNLTAATLGASLAFLVARYLAQDWVTNKAGGRLKMLLDGVEAEGWKFIAFVRLVPLFPFNLLNYALGLTRIRFAPYVVASYVFMLPGAIAYTYLGYAGREAATGAEGFIQKGLLALALLALVAFLPALIKRLRTTPINAPTLTVVELKQRLDRGEDILVLDMRGEDERHGSLGHIASSKGMTLNELAAREIELHEHKNRPIAVVCRTDRRSSQAIVRLKPLGYTGLLLVPGGMEAWNRSGFPIDR
jgi:uncharacterized membrane protein YdjX (TVP38/TMEM64 family)